MPTLTTPSLTDLGILLTATPSGTEIAVIRHPHHGTGQARVGQMTPDCHPLNPGNPYLEPVSRVKGFDNEHGWSRREQLIYRIGEGWWRVESLAVAHWTRIAYLRIAGDGQVEVIRVREIFG